MTSTRLVITVIALAVSGALVAAGILLFPALQDAAANRHPSSYDSAAEMTAESDLAVAWIPSDATSIRIVEPARGGRVETAAVLLESASSLDPAICTVVERRSAPTLSVAGAPDAYPLRSVYACGDWTVAPAAKGWYGWTPNSAEESAASPGE